MRGEGKGPGPGLRRRARQTQNNGMAASPVPLLQRVPAHESNALLMIAHHCALDPALRVMVPNFNDVLGVVAHSLAMNPALAAYPDRLTAQLVCAAVRTASRAPPMLKELFEAMDADGAECCAADPVGFVLDKARVAREFISGGFIQEGLHAPGSVEAVFKALRASPEPGSMSTRITPRRVLKHIALMRYDAEYIGLYVWHDMDKGRGAPPCQPA